MELRAVLRNIQRVYSSLYHRRRSVFESVSESADHHLLLMALKTQLKLLFLMMSEYMLRASPLSLRVPLSISALDGSCLLIPCSFSPTLAGSQMELRLLKSFYYSFFFSRMNQKMQTVFSTDPSEAQKTDLRTRISLAGNMSEGDCSLSLSRISKEDQSVYELQMRESKEKRWNPRARFNLTITILMSFDVCLSAFRKLFCNKCIPEPPELSDPGPVLEDQWLQLNCSLKLLCAVHRPQLIWKFERGFPANSSAVSEIVELSSSQDLFLRLWSSVSFTVPKNSNLRVRCEAQYQQNRRSSASRQILVHFPPRSVRVEMFSESVRPGGSALLVCSCKSDPPATHFKWKREDSGLTHFLPKHTPTVRIYNISRHTRVQCSAANKLGWGSSQTTDLNIHFPPMVLSSSLCVWDGSVLSCECVVDSNPPAAVSWSVNDTYPKEGFNVTSSSSSSSSSLVVTLVGFSSTPLSVKCYAVNALGNHTHPLLLLHRTPDGAQVWAVFSSVCAALFLILMLALMLYYRSRTSRRRSILPPESLHSSQERHVYLNLSEVTHIYTNGSYQLIYQNCTPRFVRSTQMHKRQRRRGAKRQRERPPYVNPDPEAAVYVEVI
ncbi:hypothetical protein DNTS_024430 [Danionella cerebrum]|uniref:Ig-like domain-containing protein n=1 Tax=Danionella cerebrum TaxID=2873325 RepID=A0A553MKI6_9TELE|nr:hypothetical protein DNTS_024430 [Danionella translucida]